MVAPMLEALFFIFLKLDENELKERNKKGHKNHITFFPTASSDGFVEYENLSQNTVKNWVKNTESNFYALTASYETEISNSIASQSRGDLPPLC